MVSRAQEEFSERHLVSAERVGNGYRRVGSLYVAPHYNTVEMQGYLIQHYEALPPTNLITIVGADTNAGIKWHIERDGTPVCRGSDCKGRAIVDAVQALGSTLRAPQDSQLDQPTSRPRQQGRQGRAIDWLASTRTQATRATICTDSCFQLGTDHDLIAMQFPLAHCGRNIKRLRTGKRVIISEFEAPSRIDQETLSHLAKHHTDNANVKRFFQQARRTRSPGDWKLALRARKAAHDQWKRDRIVAAVSGDWNAVRAIEPLKSLGWESRFVDNIAPQDPHLAIHDHFTNVFASAEGIIRRTSRIPPGVRTLLKRNLIEHYPYLAQGRVWGLMGSAQSSCRNWQKTRSANKGFYVGTTPFCILGPYHVNGWMSCSSSSLNRILHNYPNSYVGVLWDARRKSCSAKFSFHDANHISLSRRVGSAALPIVRQLIWFSVYTDLPNWKENGGLGSVY